MRNGIIIKNTNGFKYEIISEKPSYALLKRVKDGEPVVVWDLKKHGNCYVWGQGHYFVDLEDAQKYFDEK